MKTLLLLIFIQITLISYSQKEGNETTNPERLNFREFRLSPQRVAPADITLPFSSIKLIDSRFDTSKLGFLPFDNIVPDKRNVFRKIRFKGDRSIAVSLEEYYNEYYKKSFLQNGFELLIVMKRFWVSGVDYTRSKGGDLVNNLDATTNLYCKWEYYLVKADQYLPIKRLDTIMQVNDDLAVHIAEEFNERRLAKLKFCLKALIELFDFDNAVIVFDKQPKKSLSEIIKFNNKRNEIKVLQDSIKKGIYLNFDDFKMNNPTITEYKEKQTSYGLFKSENYLEDMNGNLITDYWGYSDGKNFRFGKFGNDKIYRVGNTFEFFVQVKQVAFDNSTPVATKGNIKVWMPYQIDMENGLVY